jgi:phosphoribosylformylglycinamidine synthase
VPGALLHNTFRKFTCKNVFITPATTDVIITQAMQKGRAYKIPVAHGEGNFYVDDATLKKMKANGQVLFNYCDAEGKITPEANPNGSLENIAGICNSKKNVFGMMPHPERAADIHLGNTDGLALFNSIVNLVLK